MFQKSIVILTFAYSLTFSLTGCQWLAQSNRHIDHGAKGPIAQLLSTRSEEGGPLRVLVRFPSAPLAKTPQLQRADQLILIEKEHAQFKQKLSQISNDIQIIYTYRTILNALYVVIPEKFAAEVDPVLPNGTQVSLAVSFRRPEILSHESATTHDLSQHNSVKFIGADQLHKEGVRGHNIKVGVIDTGIDYTHSMLGGSGLIADYQKIDPAQNNSQFPNAKVVGGYDFVGTDYDSAAAKPALRIPKPDSNPLDESGHGSHVAGTIAGIGDGKTSYTGVAPDAALYALKVFGADGSTDDAVVIAALEYAADLDGQINTNDPLDVVNLSLGSPYGTPKLLYKEAVENLNRMGTIIVASAGNSGNNGYITGAPGVSDEALSVAAGIDDMDHNWHVKAVEFQTNTGEEILGEMAESTFTKTIESFESIKGKLVYIGKAGTLTPEQAEALKGNIALIDRGETPFYDKITNAKKAEAIAAIVINDIGGIPMPMGGGRETLDIPAIMITMETGQKIRDLAVKGHLVTADLKTKKQFAKPELIDTITGFSSRGPRSEDSLIKPEITAPGSKIVSAQVGGGTEVTQMSGTSMAAPHMAGVMALLKQKNPSLTPGQIKSLAMLSAKSIHSPDGQTYPIAQQGAGRVQVPAAADTGITVEPASLSLGRHEIQLSKTLVKTLTFKNLSKESTQLTLEPFLHNNVQLLSPRTINLKGNEEISVSLKFRLTTPNKKDFSHELDSFLILKDQRQKTYSLPLLAVVLKMSEINANHVSVHSSSKNDSTGSLATLHLLNKSPHSGKAYLFHLLGKDALKDERGLQKNKLSTACDLQSVGFRTLTLKENGFYKDVLQMALKLYAPVTTWNNCEFSVLIDANGDGIAEQELAGVDRRNTEGLGKGMASLLLDATKTRTLRKEYQDKIEKNEKDVSLDFTSAIESTMDLMDFKQSSLMIIQTPIEKLKTVPGKSLRVKVAALSLEMDAIESDDFLGEGWLELPLNPEAQTLREIPNEIEVEGNSDTLISMIKGEGDYPMILFSPMNHGTMASAQDHQAKILELVFGDKD
ncbi:MAG: hypothetical protein RJB66_1871 [Pseudomonadota bacterium]|jgi:subtilisin family serine protease